jgi:hypothetical protein
MSKVICKHCTNDIWDIGSNTASCTNCGLERPYTRRKRGNTITPSQKAASQRIANYFKNNWNRGRPLAKVKERFDSRYGFLFLVVETTDNIYTTQGGHYCIGRRGGIEQLGACDLGANDGHTKHMAKHYAKMLGARIA